MVPGLTVLVCLTATGAGVRVKIPRGVALSYSPEASICYFTSARDKGSSLRHWLLRRGPDGTVVQDTASYA